MSLSFDSCSSNCREIRKIRTRELLELLSQNESEYQSSSTSYMSLSSEGSDITEELIIERLPPENKHDDPPEVYARLDNIIQQWCKERYKTHHEPYRISDEDFDLDDIQPRNREEVIRMSVEDYNDFGCKRFRTSSPDLRKNNKKNMDVEEVDVSWELSNETQLSQYYVKKDGRLRRVEVNDSEVQVDLKNAWQSIKEKYFEKVQSFEIRKIN